MVRALEVGALTGRPFRATLPAGAYARPAVQVGLDVPRDVLDERIAARVDRMWRDGLVEEVGRLDAEGLSRGRTAARALGYAQVLRLLAGELTDDEARAQTVAATRRYARRQESWFRRDPRVTWLPDDPDLVARASSISPLPWPGDPEPPDRRPFRQGPRHRERLRAPARPRRPARAVASTVAALCDRRSGIGGDGLIRVVRADALPDGHGQDVEWFMDYRNADGSPAQMCGNGTRVFAAYLAAAGLADLPDGAAVRIGTRAGIKTVRREGAEFVTDLGPWFVPGGADAAGRGAGQRGVADRRPSRGSRRPAPGAVRGRRQPAHRGRPAGRRRARGR